jgi:hypothetical protein
MDGKQIRNAIYAAVTELHPKGAGFQYPELLQNLRGRLEILSVEDEQAILDEVQVLFHEGLLGRGLGLDNPDLPFLHLTLKGKEHFATR